MEKAHSNNVLIGMPAGVENLLLEVDRLRLDTFLGPIGFSFAGTLVLTGLFGLEGRLVCL